MPYTSNLGYIGVGSQGTQKTTAATPEVFFQYLTDEMATEFDELVFEEGGNGKYKKNSIKTQCREKVGWSFYARPRVSAEVFSALLGKDTPTHLTTTPKYHAITIKTTDTPAAPVQPWLTVEKTLVTSTVSKTHRITGVKLSSVTLEGEAGQPCKVTCEGTGLSSAIRTTASTATYETDMPLSFYHGTYNVNLPTTANVDIKSFNVKISAVNDEGIQTTGLTRADIINHRYDAEVTVTLNYSDYTMWKKANYAASTIPVSGFSDGSFHVVLSNGATTANRRIEILIPKVRLAAHSIPLNPTPVTIEQPLSGMAFKQATTELLTVTVYNNVTTTMPL